MKKNIALSLLIYIAVCLIACQKSTNSFEVESITAFNKPSAMASYLSSGIFIDNDQLYLVPKLIPPPSEWSKNENAYQYSVACVYNGEIDTNQNLSIEADITVIKQIFPPTTEGGIELEIEAHNNQSGSDNYTQSAEFDFLCQLENKNLIIKESYNGADSSYRQYTNDLAKFKSSDKQSISLVIEKKDGQLRFSINNQTVATFAPKHWLKNIYVTVKSTNYKVLIDKFDMNYRSGVTHGTKPYKPIENTQPHNSSISDSSVIKQAASDTSTADTPTNDKRSFDWNTVNTGLAIVASCLTIIAVLISFKRKS